MKDIEMAFGNTKGNLALMGETLGKANISLEGGGVFENGDVSITHYLMDAPEKAKIALEKIGIQVNKINEVII
ncbi:hypothetical protein LCGC14_3108750 [marine sediment metagenome]|uniref:ACT domain-containing protein n=1 Tax=marine sediment metagenome TaxID=412755 RepID=A0A0F8YD41_9ZZZZ